jgi:hypothetical protein
MGTSLTGNPVVSIATHEHSSSAASCTQEASFASAGADLPMIWSRLRSRISLTNVMIVHQRPWGSSTVRGAHQRPGGEDHVR